MQPFKLIITAYVTSRGTLSLLISVCEIVDPVPAVNPVTLPTADAVHVNVIPGTFPIRLMTTFCPEHETGNAGTTESTIAGKTVTVTTKGLPTHPLYVGVMV